MVTSIFSVFNLSGKENSHCINILIYQSFRCLPCPDSVRFNISIGVKSNSVSKFTMKQPVETVAINMATNLSPGRMGTFPMLDRNKEDTWKRM